MAMDVVSWLEMPMSHSLKRPIEFTSTLDGLTSRLPKMPATRAESC